MNLAYSIIDLKHSLYDKGFFKTYAAPIPVISVGNINMGGSGKTPFIIYLVEMVLKLNPIAKIAIISKSYKANLKSPALVNLASDRAAAKYGDEACFLKTILQEKVQVWSGPVKWQTLKAAVESNFKYDLAIIDDGFSHRKIKKNLDIVLFDVSRPISHYRPLPFGRLRENLKQLSRANLVVLTKIENQKKEKISQFEDLIKEFNPQIIHSSFKMITPSPDQKYFLFCGVGHPEHILKACYDHKIQLSGHHFFKDHHSYTASIQNKLLKDNPDQQFLTTEKDLVKLTVPELIDKTQILKLEVHLSSTDESVLNEKISQII